MINVKSGVMFRKKGNVQYLKINRYINIMSSIPGGKKKPQMILQGVVLYGLCFTTIQVPAKALRAHGHPCHTACEVEEKMCLDISGKK